MANWQMCEWDTGWPLTIFLFVTFHNKIVCSIITYCFFLFRTASVEKPVPVLSFRNKSALNSVFAQPFQKKSFYVPYPYWICGIQNDPFRFRTHFEIDPVPVTSPNPYLGAGTESLRNPYPYSGVWSPVNLICNPLKLSNIRKMK